jgi:hypothetical protein
MIEQVNNILMLTFPTADSATTFAIFLQSLVTITSSPQPSQPASEISSQPSESSPETKQAEAPDPIAASSIQVFPEPKPSPDMPLWPQRSRHTVLTPERQDQIANQRAAGMTTRQRLLRAQTTLRDGVLPFSRPGQTVPQPTGQPSPRQKAALEGGFADGAPEVRRPLAPEARRPLVPGPRQGSRLRPVL